MDIASARSLKAELLDFSPRTTWRGPAGLETRSAGLGRATLGGPRDLPAPAPLPVAIGIAPDRGGRDTKLVLIGTKESERDHPTVERALRLAKNEAEFFVTGVPQLLSYWRPTHRRPLELGVSVGHQGHAPGTLGAFVTMADGAHCMLSANHVFAGVNMAQPGDPIIQPGRNDGAPQDAAAVGALRRFVELQDEPGRNQVDCAVADLAEGVAPTTAFATNEGEEPFHLTGLGAADALFGGDEVIKFGRTTGRTSGRVLAVEVDNFLVNLGTWQNRRMCRFDNQMHIYSEHGPFARPGDSGALVVDAEGRAHGMVFAGTAEGGPRGTGLATANMLEVALSALDAKLWLG